MGTTISSLILFAVLVLVTRNFTFNALYFGSLLLTGFFLGEFIEKHLSIERIMIYTTICVFTVGLLILLLYSFGQSQGIEQLITNYASRYQTLSAELFSESSQLYPEMNIDPKTLQKISTIIAIAFPGILINSYLTMVWLNILLIKKLLLTKGITVKSIENLSHWKASDYLIFGVIGLSILIFIPIDALKFIGVNCLIVLMIVYFFQGIAVATFFFKKKSIPLILRFFFYVLIAVQPLFMILVIGFGLFDNWFNFRKLNAT